MNTQCGCKDQQHVHEIIGSTKYVDGCDCHNHRFCTVSDEAQYIPGQNSHYHEVKFRTDISDGHYHEFCGKTSAAIDVGQGEHVHFINDFTNVENRHKHEFQVATLIDSPTDSRRK